MALMWKMICNLGDPMSLRHPVVDQVVLIMAAVLVERVVQAEKAGLGKYWSRLVGLIK